jgi:hypothetical protein
MATMAVRPELGTPLLALVVPAKVLVAVLAGAAVVSLMRGHFGLVAPRRGVPSADGST